jgi:GNAT superfamily N-acetyltransferase
MIDIREATINDVPQIREVFLATYGEHYPYADYCDIEALNRLVYADGTILLVAADADTGKVLGTASVVFEIGAYNDLVGEFGRLAVHPDARGQGLGKRLMAGRIERVRNRIHVGIVENRSAHIFSQRISSAHGFVPVGFIPMKLLLQQRESVGLYVRHFGPGLELRRNNPRVIPEVSQLAGLALYHCRLPCDCIIDDASAPYPLEDKFELEEMQTDGYATLLRIQRGRLSRREVFGPVRLHYGLFQIHARRSHYLLARQNGQIAGGIGFMIDQSEKTVRIFELISRSDEPVRFLIEQLIQKCVAAPGIEFIEIDVSAYAPRLQRTLLELNFEPVGYIPANVFHEVERLDVVKMARLHVPFDVAAAHISQDLRPVAETVIRGFASRDVAPRIARAARHVPLFTGLNDEQRNRLAACGTPGSFRSGEHIFRQGDTSSSMHLILDGQVELFIDQQSAPVAELSAGQCLGETSLLHPEKGFRRSATAIAKTGVDTAAFSVTELRELIRRRPDVGVVIFRNLAADVSTKLSETDRRLV